MDRGKVMTARNWTPASEFGRYLDVDGDGIPYRTYPGTHPTRGAFFTRGTSPRPLRPLHRIRHRLPTTWSGC
jgi:2-oxoglutarate ferredoxin oxidoreductase subunit alpha